MLEHHNNKNPGARGAVFLIFLLAASIILFCSLSVMANEMCTKGTQSLRGDYEVIQGKGGLWTLMEQAGLKDQSVLGLQTDSKMLRTIVALETLCQDGKTPDKAVFKKIANLLSDGRLIFNLNPHKTPPRKIIEKITALSKNSDDILKSLGQ